jgi:DHA2 family multidrug resistance protein
MSTGHHEGALQGGQLWLAAIMLASANFIAVLDMTIANVSVPTITGNLGISATQGTWIITSYSVAEAISVPLTGWLAGRFGPVRLMTIAMLLFGLFSAVCGFAGSLSVLVFGRVMQGLTGGLLMPLSQTLLMRIFPASKAPTAMALWAMTTLVAPVVGPIAGGYLCDQFAWPLIFFVNLPIAFLCSPALRRLLRSYEAPLVKMPIDKVGLVLLIIFVGSLQLMLDLGKEHDWFESREIIALAVVAVIGFAAFLIWELTEEYPIVDLRIFRHRGFTASVITLGLGFGAMFGSNVVTPMWLQTYMGYTATWAGLATAWSGVLAVVAAPFAGKLMTKVDPRKLIFGGLVWLSFVMLLRSGITSDITYGQIIPPLILMGAGLPFFFVPLTALSLGSVEEKETASAAGLQNFLRTLSGAVATSLVTTMWENKTSVMHEELTGVLDPDGNRIQAVVNAGVPLEAVLRQLNGLVQGQSVTIATNQTMTFVAFVFMLAAAVVWLSPKPTRAVDMTQAGH